MSVVRVSVCVCFGRVSQCKTKSFTKRSAINPSVAGYAELVYMPHTQLDVCVLAWALPAARIAYTSPQHMRAFLGWPTQARRLQTTTVY